MMMNGNLKWIQQIRKFASKSKSLTQTTTLDNGIKVSSTYDPSHFVSLGIYVNTGSRYETVSGSSFMMDRMSFKVIFIRNLADKRRVQGIYLQMT